MKSREFPIKASSPARPILTLFALSAMAAGDVGSGETIGEAARSQYCR